jgi:GT2 family glycosyltransferase
MFDLVTVFHNDRNHKQAKQLEADLHFHADADYVLWNVDNREENRGFSKGSNLGASWGSQPFIGFLNPDSQVSGPLLSPVLRSFQDENVVITGERFNKPQSELRTWGVRDWVCGACFFVRRSFWEEAGGFDEQFVWGWEETDLIRYAEISGRCVRSISLPVYHESPQEETQEDFAYKRKHFAEGAALFYRKWR